MDGWNTNGRSFNAYSSSAGSHFVMKWVKRHQNFPIKTLRREI